MWVRTEFNKQELHQMHHLLTIFNHTTNTKEEQQKKTKHSFHKLYSFQKCTTGKFHFGMKKTMNTIK